MDKTFEWGLRQRDVDGSGPSMVWVALGPGFLNIRWVGLGQKIWTHVL